MPISKRDSMKLMLEEKEKVDTTQKRLREIFPEIETVYVPNLMPKREAKYIFVGSEPSLGNWCNTPEEGREKVRKGFRNAIYEWEPLILRYCASEFLSAPYYFTDVSKAGVSVELVKKLGDEAFRIYEECGWLDLLKKEIEIVGRDDAKIISVGKDQLDFLKDNLDFSVTRILHYSKKAASHRKELEDDFVDICPSYKEILNFVKDLLERNSVSDEIKEEIMKNLNTKNNNLSDSRKRLIYTYYKKFKKI